MRPAPPGCLVGSRVLGLAAPGGRAQPHPSVQEMTSECREYADSFGKVSVAWSLALPHPLPSGPDRVLTARLGHCLEEERGLSMYMWPGPVFIFSPLTRHLPGRYFSQKAPLR